VPQSAQRIGLELRSPTRPSVRTEALGGHGGAARRSLGRPTQSAICRSASGSRASRFLQAKLVEIHRAEPSRASPQSPLGRPQARRTRGPRTCTASQCWNAHLPSRFPRTMSTYVPAIQSNTDSGPWTERLASAREKTSLSLTEIGSARNDTQGSADTGCRQGRLPARRMAPTRSLAFRPTALGAEFRKAFRFSRPTSLCRTGSHRTPLANALPVDRGGRRPYSRLVLSPDFR
jgi:hypothetical protein